MLKPISVLLVATLLLAGCGSVRDSRINPFNWFGNDTPSGASDIETAREKNPLIPELGPVQQSRAERERYKGTPIDSVTDVTLERIPGGVLLRATGVAATQGVYDAQLTPVTEDGPVDGVIIFSLDALNDPDLRTQGPVQTRDVIVATTLTDQDLGNARTIRVAGARNAIDIRRR